MFCSGFKSFLGLKEEAALVVTKEILGKKRLDELRKEFSGLEHK